MEKSSRIYIAGHRGMVGSALLRQIQEAGFTDVVTRTSQQLDLRDSRGVLSFFEEVKPAYAFIAAAKVGGIQANTIYRAEFLYDNLMIAANTIDSAYKVGVKKLLFLGSSCIYPKLAHQPLVEDALLTGELEATNEPYAIAKIAGIKLCEAYRDQYGANFISAMPTNLYGSNDNYDLQNSHVLPALIRKFHEAKEEGNRSVQLWGSGKPLREFMHVDDCARALILLMNSYDERQFVNVGVGEDISIYNLALLVQEVVGHRGSIEWDESKPDGTPRKLMDNSKLRELGFAPSIDLRQGVEQVYADFQRNYERYVVIR